MKKTIMTSKKEIIHICDICKKVVSTTRVCHICKRDVCHNCDIVYDPENNNYDYPDIICSFCDENGKEFQKKYEDEINKIDNLIMESDIRKEEIEKNWSKKIKELLK